MAKIIVNDEEQEVTLPVSVAELIKLNKVFQPGDGNSTGQRGVR